MKNPGPLQIPGPEDMLALGVTIGRHIFGGAVLGLSGPMGAGKTTLVRGIADGMEIAGGHFVSSPTFTILQTYPCRDLTLYHLDLYRISGREDLDSTGFRDHLGTQGVIVIEWVEREPDVMPSRNLLIEIEYNGIGRKVSFRAKGEAHRSLASRVAAQFIQL